MPQKTAWQEAGDHLLFNLIFGTATLLIVILLYRDSWAAITLLSLVGIAGLYKWKSRATSAIFFLGGIICALAETAAINAGAWSYSTGGLLNAPIWIYVVWGNASAFIYKTANELKVLLGFSS